MTAISTSLAARAKALITRPADEWPVIAAESATPAHLMRGWTVPLAAIGPVAGFIRGQLKLTVVETNLSQLQKEVKGQGSCRLARSLDQHHFS